LSFASNSALAKLCSYFADCQAQPMRSGVAAVESVMPSDEGKRGNRFGAHRLILEGIAWRFCWRDLPPDFGSWQTVWKRRHRWSLDGTYEAMLAQLAAVFGFDAGMAEEFEKLLSVDSTNVRVHQHCAGARSDTLA
jgi:putative transposase